MVKNSTFPTPGWGRPPGEGLATHPGFWPGKYHGQRGLGAAVHGSPRVRHDLQLNQHHNTQKLRTALWTNRLIGALATKSWASRRRPLRGLPLRVSLREGTSPPGVRARLPPQQMAPRLRCPVETAASTFQTLSRFWGPQRGHRGGHAPGRDHPRPD